MIFNSNCKVKDIYRYNDYFLDKNCEKLSQEIPHTQPLAII